MLEGARLSFSNVKIVCNIIGPIADHIQTITLHVRSNVWSDSVGRGTGRFADSSYKNVQLNSCCLGFDGDLMCPLQP